nr:hypothetical protein [uncultured Pseudomonas sp.]
MTAKRMYKGDISEAIYSSAAMLHKIGALDKATLRDFDARHLVVPEMIEPAQIRPILAANNVSQPAFARYPNAIEK